MNILITITIFRMIGAHFSVDDTPYEQYKNVFKIAQIFVTNPKSGKPLKNIPELVARCKKWKFVIHGSFVDHPNHFNFAKNLDYELGVSEKVGALGVIIHLHKDVYNHIDTMANIANDHKNTLLWLEINATKPGNNSFETPEKINALFDVMLTKTKNIGLCIDSAHLYSCGTDLGKKKVFEQYFAKLRGDIPIMLHLNDSAKELGSGIDQHAPLGQGNIWKFNNKDTLVRLLHLAEDHGWPVILERNDITEDIKLLKKMGFLR